VNAQEPPVDNRGEARHAGTVVNAGTLDVIVLSVRPGNLNGQLVGKQPRLTLPH